MKIAFRALIVAVSLALASSSAQVKPALSLSEARIEPGDVIEVHGTGFTSKRYALSHLRKPDGLEYQVRRFLTNDRGEYFQNLDSAMLELGAHELWAIDEDSKAVSDVVRFEVRAKR